MNDIYSLHKREYGVEPDAVVSAPAKINLMGEHSEHVEGCILSLTLDKRIYVSISRRDDKQILFYSSTFEERKRATITGLKYKKDDRWANYLKGVVSTLIQTGSELTGFNLTICSDIPPGIGMSSSTSMTVAMTVAIKKAFSLDIEGIQLVELARQSEQRYSDVMSPSIISSPFVVYYSKEGTALFLDIEKLNPQYIPFEFGDAKIVITNSNLPAVMTNAEIAQFHAEWKKSFEVFQRRKKASINKLDSMDVLDDTEEIPEPIKRCLLHLVDENNRVEEMKNALLEKDLVLAGKLMTRAHESARDLMEISCPELDWLVKRALETPGVYGARMIGDGFGGCTVMLIDINHLGDYEKHLQEYEHIFGFKAEYFICETSTGVEPMDNLETD